MDGILFCGIILFFFYNFVLYLLTTLCAISVVVATAKVRIFKQITTVRGRLLKVIVLLLLPQRYEFSSKSQHDKWNSTSWAVVVATAKVRIFKQITTGKEFELKYKQLLLLPQRYEFSSKSQPLTHCGARRMVVVATAKVRIFKQITTGVYQASVDSRCCCYRKGTNFQANHNQAEHNKIDMYVVVATAKVRIFKQITTYHKILYLCIVLLLLPQRYEFSSKSQQQ